MFGNSSGMKDQSGPGEMLDILGRLTSEPRAALEDLVAVPQPLSGSAVMALAVTGRILSGPLPWDQGLDPVLRRSFTSLIGSLLLWLGLTAVAHLISRLTGKKGRFAAFLSLTGWAGAILWAELPLRLLAGASGSGFFVVAPRVLLRIGVYGLWWWGLQRVYGWTPLRALLLLLIPAAVFGALVFAAGLLTAAFFAAHAAFFRHFL